MINRAHDRHPRRHGTALDWDELDNSGRRGPDLIRRVAIAYCVLLRDDGKFAEADGIDGEMERLIKQYAPARKADSSDQPIEERVLE